MQPDALLFYHGRSLVPEGGQRCYIFAAQRFYQQRDRWNDLYLAERIWSYGIASNPGKQHR
jgi:hypothetical protein